MTNIKTILDKHNVSNRLHLVVVALALILLQSWPGASQALASPGADESSCVSCHQNDIDDDQTLLVSKYLKGAHAKRGVVCVDCHGGDASADDEDEAMDEDAGFTGAPERHEIPAFCSSCHSDPNYMRGFNPNIPTDQYSKYLVSGHGKLLTEKGDDKVAVCTSCHGVHGILPSNNPLSPVYVSNIPATCSGCHSDSAYMSGHDIPVDQLAEYETSVHGIALLEKGDRAAPACSGCHGSHEARIPDPSGVANTCAQCHNFIRELFVSSPHKAAHEEHNYPECEVCHGNHAIQNPLEANLLAADGGVCAECHDDGSKGMKTALTMFSSISDLQSRIDSITEVVGRVETIGMDVEDALYQLRQANDELIKSRTLVHTFSADRVAEVTADGFEKVTEAAVSGAALLELFDFRRKGFIVSVLVIFLLSVLLTLKIRSMGGIENED